MENEGRGMLYLVGTPIGNMNDITLRALDTLNKVDLIAAEDTRQTRKLLSHFSIQKPVTSYFEHNKQEKGPVLINALSEGKSVALVSDAGMPGISDPGNDLVRECIRLGIPVSVIPGPSALLTGLVASGLETASFVFGGFFPRDKKARKTTLEGMREERRTMVFFESPRRLVRTLQDILEACGDRQCCVARELTKRYEEYHRGTLSEVLAYYDKTGTKGEITLVVAGRPPGLAVPPSWEQVEREMEILAGKGVNKKDAVKKIAKEIGISKRELYNRFMK
ncbi:MAG: 16S rRNA (cytidine(1402)-2'-O)-methyltransferase [Peptococcaceae bacterium]|nr:16S rRNA (cytidine(1402)-2'-O)-methyltransferase [Peptococcaceae bacterium]MDH7525180.1 16S rRNA (cytidine(1402)-2'-O)-methyltransferase [Peptococcaceae bacterium]